MAQPKQAKYDDEDQEKLISQIKSIASQIFTSDFDEFISIDLCIPQSHRQHGPRAFSYTDRPIQLDRQDCMSQWINYEDFNLKQTPNPYKSSTSPHQHTQIKQKNKLTNNSNIRHAKANKNKQSESTQGKTRMKKNNQSINPNQQITKTLKQSEIKAKLDISKLSQYGFMKPIKNIGPQIIAETYKKQQKQQQTKPKKMKTLEQLYSEKEPLYQRYTRERQKKIIQISESRIKNQQKEVEQLKQKPDINKNIKIYGSFEERLRANTKKNQQSKAKIMHDILKDSPFHPNLCSPKRYKKVQSIVKKNWSYKNSTSPNQELHSQQLFLNEERSIPKQQLFVEANKNKNEFKKLKKIHDLRLNNTNQLSNILQMKDTQQQ